MDLTNLYAFPKLGGAQQVDPNYERASVPPGFPRCRGPAGAHPDRTLLSRGSVRVKIDTDGNAVADITYRVRF